MRRMLKPLQSATAKASIDSPTPMRTSSIDKQLPRSPSQPEGYIRVLILAYRHVVVNMTHCVFIPNMIG